METKNGVCFIFFPPLNKVVQALLSCVVKDPPQLPNDKPNSLQNHSKGRKGWDEFCHAQKTGGFGHRLAPTHKLQLLTLISTELIKYLGEDG